MGTFIRTTILKSHRIGQTIVGKQFSVTVIDLTPGTVKNPFLFDREGKIVQIILAVYDL